MNGEGSAKPGMGVWSLRALELPGKMVGQCLVYLNLKRSPDTCMEMESRYMVVLQVGGTTNGHRLEE